MKRTILLLLTAVLTLSSWASDELGYQINVDLDGNVKLGFSIGRNAQLR